jgi:hypothetical protein
MWVAAPCSLLFQATVEADMDMSSFVMLADRRSRVLEQWFFLERNTW